MVFIPRTYVRAAGTQSEIGKMTVNKVAYLQNDYRRMVHMAKMDMKKTLREIKHNREIMRRSMGRYRKKLKEYQIVKERKYLVELEEDPVNLERFNSRREEENVTVKKLVLPKINAAKNIISQNTATTKSFKNEPTIVADRKHEIKCHETNSSDSQVLLENEMQLPPINTENHNVVIKENPEINSHSDLNQDDTPTTEPNESPDIHKTPESMSSEPNTGTQAVQSVNEPLDTQTSREKTSVNKAQSVKNTPEVIISSTSEEMPKIPKKRRTGAVNLSNIMRLQYSTNLKALFKTVDVLAKVHGINGTLVDREMSGPRGISKRPSLSLQPTAGNSSTGEKKRTSTISIPESLSGKSDTRRLSQESAPRRMSHISASQGRRLSHVSADNPKQVLPSDYLYNMKYGYLDTEVPVLEEEQNAKRASATNIRPPSGIDPPINRNIKVDNNHAEKGSRKISILSTSSSPYSSRRVSSNYNPLSSSQSVDSSDSRPRRSILRGDRTMAKVSQSSIPQPYPDDYFERAQPEPDKDVAWQTAFGMLKHVHFIDSSELAA